MNSNLIGQLVGVTVVIIVIAALLIPVCDAVSEKDVTKYNDDNPGKTYSVLTDSSSIQSMTYSYEYNVDEKHSENNLTINGNTAYFEGTFAFFTDVFRINTLGGAGAYIISTLSGTYSRTSANSFSLSYDATSSTFKTSDGLELGNPSYLIYPDANGKYVRASSDNNPAGFGFEYGKNGSTAYFMNYTTTLKLTGTTSEGSTISTTYTLRAPGMVWYNPVSHGQLPVNTMSAGNFSTPTITASDGTVTTGDAANISRSDFGVTLTVSGSNTVVRNVGGTIEYDGTQLSATVSGPQSIDAFFVNEYTATEKDPLIQVIPILVIICLILATVGLLRMERDY